MSSLDEAQRAARVDLATVDKLVLLAVALDRGEWYCQNGQDGAEKMISIFAVSVLGYIWHGTVAVAPLVLAVTNRPYLADFENHQHHAPRST
jgi:hypothetical protein